MRTLRRFRPDAVQVCSPSPFKYPNQDPNKVIQTLWTHGKLSIMEKLCMRSYIDNGHEVHLYVYDEVEGIPEGVVVKNGNEVLPREEYDYRRFINNGTFADYFRIKLLLEKGGWWVDTDLICLKNFSISAPYSLGRMGPWSANEGSVVCNNSMKFPAGSNLMLEAWNRCKGYDPSKVNWSVEVGPMLIDSLVNKYSMGEFILGTEAFNPVDWRRVRDFSNPDVEWHWSESTFAVHLWNDMWSGRTNWKDEHTWKITGCPPILQDKEIVIEGSLYGDLIKKYLKGGM